MRPLEVVHDLVSDEDDRDLVPHPRDAVLVPRVKVAAPSHDDGHDQGDDDGEADDFSYIYLMFNDSPSKPGILNILLHYLAQFLDPYPNA